MIEISPHQAARMLDVGVKTIRRWADAALDGRGSQIRYARRAINRRLFVDLNEIEELKRVNRQTTIGPREEG